LQAADGILVENGSRFRLLAGEADLENNVS
jgi:hypothetical protein